MTSPEPVGGVPLDTMVRRVLASSPFVFRLAESDERETCFRLRGDAVVQRGWRARADLQDGVERDAYDDRALHVLGWDGPEPMSTGRIVLPPGLPTEDACGIRVAPAGRVVDVGRMCVAQSHQGLEHTAFIGLLCALYLQVRELGFDVACGMMSPSARSLVGLLGLRLELLGPQREYWNEPRAPVRFSLLTGQPDGPAASTSTVLAPPNPKELDTAHPSRTGRG
jgi:hypothetical protein